MGQNGTRMLPCLHLHAHWASLMVAGGKPTANELPAGYPAGTQFEFRTWSLLERWPDGAATLPVTDLILTTSDFLLGRDGPEDATAKAVAAFDVVSVEPAAEADQSRFSAAIGFDQGVKFIWVVRNVRPFPIAWLDEDFTTLGAVRGIYLRPFPADLLAELRPTIETPVEELARVQRDLRTRYALT